MKTGACDYITKPIFDMKILDVTVNHVLERAKLILEKNKYHKNLEEELRQGTYYEGYYLHHTGCHYCRTDLRLSGKKNEGRLYTLTAGIRHSRYGSHIALYTDNIFLT